MAILTIAHFVTFRWFLVARFIRFQRLPRLSEFFDRTETRKSIKTKYHRTSDCTIRMAVYTNEFEIVFDKIRTNYPNAFRIGILVMYIVIIGTDEYRCWTLNFFLDSNVNSYSLCGPLSRLTVINGEIGYLFQLSKFEPSKVKIIT